MIQLCKNLLFSAIAVIRMYMNYKGKKYRDRAILSEMVRNVHSIEKGMCLQQPRLLYGMKKIGFLMQITDEYLNAGYDKNRDELKMVCGALNSYVNFHKERGCENADLENIRAFAGKLCKAIAAETDCTEYGGYIKIERAANEKPSTLDALLENRHSIRDFSDTPVEETLIRQAVQKANRCPSACNRQTTSVYILDKDKLAQMKQWLSGIGGFAENVDKFLLITGRTSAFNGGEVYQHIVNAGIFAGTLTLCLSELGIGSCVVQRPLLSSPTWRKFAKANNIPGDEEIVCMMAIGIPKEKCMVPVSHRLQEAKIVRKL